TVNHKNQKSCYLVSVGTSLVINYEKRHRQDINYARIDLHNQGFQAVTSHEAGLTNATYCLYFDTIIGDLKNVHFSVLEQASAELSSLLRWRDETGKFPGFSAEDCIVLITTQTAEGILCAYALQNIFKTHWDKIKKDSTNQPFPNDFVSIEYVKGLGKATDPAFEETGLPEFLNYLHRAIVDYRAEGYEVILVPTGGYKALIPYMVLVGILHGVPLRYVYEESPRVLELPKIPLGLDMERWVREKFRLQGVLGKDYNPDDQQYKQLDHDFQSLLERDPQGKFSLSALGNFLEAVYRDLSWRSPLQLASGKTHLLDSLDDDLKEKFDRLVRIGHLIWKGDRVPEMVDHSLRHHYDLFELAERFLLPILDNNPNFLKPEELFILLGALYLHDCGHTLGTIYGSDEKPIRLFPTEIRDYHHILGYERLRHHDIASYVSKDLYEGLGWADTLQATWDDFLEIIATVGLFHRKDMPIGDGEAPYNKCPYFRNEYPPLMRNEAWPLKFRGNQMSPNRVALLVCLLRIIDSLDCQRARSGDQMEIDFHLAQIGSEAEEEKNRAGLFEKIVKGILKNDFAELSQAIQSSINGYRKRESKDHSVTAKAATTHATTTQLRGVLTKIKQKCNYDGTTAGLIFEYVLSRFRVDFKEYQKEHYADHVFVKQILIDAQRGDRISDNGDRHKTRFTIDIEVDQEIVEELALRPEEVAQKKRALLGNMREEYEMKEDSAKDIPAKTIVKDILEESGVTIEYGIDESC
ncbi:hypothetical protein HKBW3S44_01049, partial [Candidatus Hakubella thermalkaliphila]